MRKAVEIKLFDKENISLFIEKDFSGLTITKQEPDPKSDNKNNRIHTTIFFNPEQTYELFEALFCLSEISIKKEWE